MFIQSLLNRARQFRREWRSFVKQTRKHRHRCPNGLGLIGALRYFPAWRRALRGALPVDDGVPWMTFPAIRFLERFLRLPMRVFEYGSGGSTLFFAQRAASVHSIEHNPDWCRRVAACLRRHDLNNAVLELREPTPAPEASETDPQEWGTYVSSAPEFNGYSFRHYVESLDRYADGYFDVILIDGRARPACIRHAMPKVRAGGYLILDNSDLPHYQRAMHAVDARFRRQDFPGPIPYLAPFIMTTFWHRLD
jgi:predicted O-methyltransferase YrrM